MSWSEEQLDFFAEKRYLIIDDFLSLSEVKNLRELADTRVLSGEFREAGVGKGNDQRVVKTERGDWICWLDEKANEEVLQLYWNRVEGIKQIINQHFYLGLNDIESHLAIYKAGGFYKRHSDRHQISSSRRISLVLYLNETWQELDGVKLRIYLSDESVDIEPLAGRMVVFMSELEHEVLTTSVNRYSITGWAHHRELI